MIRWLVVFLSLTGLAFGRDARAKNVVLFRPMPGSTLHAASIQTHGRRTDCTFTCLTLVCLKPRRRQVVHRFRCRYDSHCHGTKRLTTESLRNPLPRAGKLDGDPQDNPEYAEERGLSRGVISNSSVLSARPPQLCHVNDRT
jgi:hypothetical protein